MFSKSKAHKEGLYPSCKECNHIYTKTNIERMLRNNKRYRAENLDYLKEYARNYVRANREYIVARRKKYIAKDPDKWNNWSKEYRKNNKGYFICKMAERRAKKLKATPEWLTTDHKNEILDLYKRAQETGMVVDHIIPLQSKIVCGLHVPWNLQLLTAQANGEKSNKLL
jgi:hypothetical protein